MEKWFIKRELKGSKVLVSICLVGEVERWWGGGREEGRCGKGGGKNRGQGDMRRRGTRGVDVGVEGI